MIAQGARYLVRLLLIAAVAGLVAQYVAGLLWRLAFNVALLT